MADISPKLVADLVAYARKRMMSPRIDDIRDDVLDYAFDDLGFDDDQDALWQEVKVALSATTTASQLIQETAQQATQQPQRNKTAPKWDDSDTQTVTAPFRFAPLNDQVSRLDAQPCPHNAPEPDRMSAVIEVDWQAETPLLIGETVEDASGKKTIEPFRLGDRYAIPGATLRGALRAVVEAAGFGRLTQLNRHQRFALRDFEHPYYKEFVTRAQGKPGLQAGWLTQEDGQPHITPCHWGYVPISELVGSDKPEDTSRWAHKDRKRKYEGRGITWTEDKAFAPEDAIAFADVGAHPTHLGLRLFKPGASNRNGHLVVSGAIPGTGNVNKKYEYVFFDAAAAPVPISETAWEVFETSNCKPSQNKRTPDGSWAEFHDTYQKGGRVPVFFVGNLEGNASDIGFSFGLTRLYRIPHRRSIGEVLLEGNKAHRLTDGPKSPHQPDFVETLFGYVHEPQDFAAGHPLGDKPADYTAPDEVARKGRVTVEFAFPIDPKAFRLWPQNGPVTTIMGPPKPSFAPFYLAGTEKDYSAEGNDLALAGRKRYLPRHRAGQDKGATGPLLSALQAQNVPGVSDEVRTHLRFLEPKSDARFRGRIRLHNVSKAELGAVLWAITFGGDPDARHLIGRGKPFGAGQVRAARLRLHIRRNDAWETPETLPDWTPDQGAEAFAPWFDAFGTEIARLTGLASAERWRKSATVAGLLAAARPRGWTAPQSGYLPYQAPGQKGQAKAFGDLRKKTGIGVARNPANRRPPLRLLGP